jgi:DNA polymerase I-like protein with 3'-5' exonuclease and polymerase domains
MGQLAAELMSSAIELNVPLKVAIKTGPNWGEME